MKKILCIMCIISTILLCGCGSGSASAAAKKAVKVQMYDYEFCIPDAEYEILENTDSMKIYSVKQYKDETPENGGSVVFVGTDKPEYTVDKFEENAEQIITTQFSDLMPNASCTDIERTWIGGAEAVTMRVSGAPFLYLNDGEYEIVMMPYYSSGGRKYDFYNEIDVLLTQTSKK